MMQSWLAVCNMHVSGVGAARPGPALEIMARIGEALRASTPHAPYTGCSRPWKAVCNLDHTLAAPMTRAIFIGSVTVPPALY